MRETEPRKQPALHQAGEVTAHGRRRGGSEQAEARIRVAPLRAGRRGGLPLPEIGDHRRLVGDAVGELQRQAARRVGAEIEQADAIERAAPKRRQEPARRILEREPAERSRVGGERCGEGLADRADLEQRVPRHRTPAFPVGEPEGEDGGTPVSRHGDGEAGHVVGLQQGAVGLLHGSGDPRRGIVCRRGSRAGQQTVHGEGGESERPHCENGAFPSWLMPLADALG